MNYTDEQLNEHFAKLPPSIREYLSGEKARHIADALCSEFAVPENLRTDFRKELLAAAIGLVSTDEFMANIQKLLRVSSEEAENIYDALDEDLLGIISALIVEVEGEMEEKENEKNTPASATPAPVPEPSKKVDPYIIGEIELPPPAIEQAHKDTPESGGGMPHKIEVPRYTPPVRPAPTAPSNLPIGQHKAPAAPQRPASILDAKLSGTTSLPTEEIDVSQQKKPRYTGTDPYREPTQ